MTNREIRGHIDYGPVQETMHLYHGSKNGIQGKIVPCYKLARRATDFGRGFYMGDNVMQAKTLACGRDEYNPVLYKTDLDLTGLRCVKVRGLPWALLIAYHRGLLETCKNTAFYDFIANIGARQDVIVGPIADDRTAIVLEEFFDNAITDAALVACMGELNLGTQYVAKTQKACDAITVTDEFPLTPNEIKSMRDKGLQRREEGVRLVAPVKRKFRRTGEYFDEILEKGVEQFALEHGTGISL